MTGPDPGSAERWLGVRATLAARRPELTRLAASLYPGIPRVGTSGLLNRPEWVPAAALDIDAVAPRWVAPGPAPAADAAGPASVPSRPLGPDGRRYPTYAAAVAALDPPAVFEDRPC